MQDPIGIAELSSLQVEQKKISTLNFKSIYDLSDSEKQLLSDKVIKKNGAVQILVHSHSQSGGKQYDKDIQDLLKNSLRSEMAIITFIECPSDPQERITEIEKYRKIYQNHIRDSNSPVTVYFVPTFIGSPVPCTLDQNLSDNKQGNHPLKENEIVELNTLADKFRKMGINKLIFSGMYYYEIKKLEPPLTDPYKKYFNSHKSMPWGCVGQAMVAFETRGFKTFRSKVVPPSK